MSEPEGPEPDEDMSFGPLSGSSPHAEPIEAGQGLSSTYSQGKTMASFPTYVQPKSHRVELEIRHLNLQTGDPAVTIRIESAYDNPVDAWRKVLQQLPPESINHLISALKADTLDE